LTEKQEIEQYATEKEACETELSGYNNGDSFDKVMKQKKLDDNALIHTGPSINNLLAVINLLPEEQSLPTILNQMHKQAKLAQLPIPSANYKWRKVKKNTVFTGRNIAQYEITFTVKGSYTAIRNMINSVLVQTPTLALDTLELKRDNSTSTLTEAKLTFLVYLIGRDE
jgi:hypothetical protein